VYFSRSINDVYVLGGVNVFKREEDPCEGLTPLLKYDIYDL